MGSIQKLLETLQVLREADITALTVRSGIERELIAAMLETLVSIGKVETVKFITMKNHAGCTIGCCSTGKKDVIKSPGVPDLQNRSVKLFRLKTAN
jgi:hypothetical protein